MKKSFVLILLLLFSACIKTKPRELKSPCVAIESNDIFSASPCVKRPVNANWLS